MKNKDLPRWAAKEMTCGRCGHTVRAATVEEALRLKGRHNTACLLEHMAAERG